MTTPIDTLGELALFPLFALPLTASGEWAANLFSGGEGCGQSGRNSVKRGPAYIRSLPRRLAADGNARVLGRLPGRGKPENGEVRNKPRKRSKTVKTVSP